MMPKSFLGVLLGSRMVFIIEFPYHINRINFFMSLGLCFSLPICGPNTSTFDDDEYFF